MQCFPRQHARFPQGLQLVEQQLHAHAHELHQLGVGRPLAELSVQALAILQLALVRAGLCEANAAAFGWTTHLMRPGAEAVPVTLVERPPLIEVPAHRKTA